MKKYSNMLKTNCKKNTKIYKYLNKINKKKCKTPGITNRETINNKKVCYDNIGKEITARLDMESNCIISDIVNKLDKKQNKIITKQKSNRIQSPVQKDNSSLEGPYFINNWNLSTYNKKIDNLSDISISNLLI
jgi:hypothetical protein